MANTLGGALSAASGKLQNLVSDLPTMRLAPISGGSGSSSSGVSAWLIPVAIVAAVVVAVVFLMKKGKSRPTRKR